MKWAVTGAVIKRNAVTRNSCTDTRPVSAQKWSIEAVRQPPTPNVVAFDGP